MSHISLKFKREKKETTATTGCRLLSWSHKTLVSHILFGFHSHISACLPVNQSLWLSLPFMTTHTSCLHTHTLSWIHRPTLTPHSLFPSDSVCPQCTSTRWNILHVHAWRISYLWLAVMTEDFCVLSRFCFVFLIQRETSQTFTSYQRWAHLGSFNSRLQTKGTVTPGGTSVVFLQIM